MLTKVTISNYKSIASCEVHLGPLTFLVGLNGSGKSNFIDALRFCRDALRGPLNQAFAVSGSNAYRVGGPSNGQHVGFALRFDLSLPDEASAHYSLSIGPETHRAFAVRKEECMVKDASGAVKEWFKRTGAGVRSRALGETQEAIDRLYLFRASSEQPFRMVYDALEGMEFYSPDPTLMKIPDISGESGVLESGAINIANVFERISDENPGARSRIEDYLRRILPGLREIKIERLDDYKLLSFEQDFRDGISKKLAASSMSDGTLRALAILVALFQRSAAASKPTLVAIEEPEAGLHPAATEALLDALSEGAMLGQVIVTSHSADLLDNREIESNSILAVDASCGTTTIGPLDAVGRSSLRDRLYTAGELLRMDQLKPLIEDGASQPVLFEA